LLLQILRGKKMDSDSEDSYMTNAERVAKQNYLREEVVEAGYDPGLFLDYCNGLNGTDVDNWTFDGLRDCVKEFRRVYHTLEAKQQEHRDQGTSDESLPERDYGIDEHFSSTEEADLGTQRQSRRTVRQSLIVTDDVVIEAQRLTALELENRAKVARVYADNHESREALESQDASEQVSSEEARRNQFEESKAPVGSSSKAPQHLPSYYEVPCKQMLPTDLSRAGNASIEVGQ
jgi:hypothetical protein